MRYLQDGTVIEKQAGYTSAQQDAMDRGQGYLVAHAIRRMNEDNKVYDVMQFMIDNEFLLFPGCHPDFMDALSRFYDMEAKPPTMAGTGSVEPAPEPDH